MINESETKNMSQSHRVVRQKRIRIQKHQCGFFFSKVQKYDYIESYFRFLRSSSFIWRRMTLFGAPGITPA